MEKTLMHTCCAPCSVSCIQQLRAEGIEPVSFWYNPNIHPFQEYKARRETLEAYAPTIGMELIVREEYGLRDFVRAVADDIEGRCRHCYRVRLEETARYAAEHGVGDRVTEDAAAELPQADVVALALHPQGIVDFLARYRDAF